MKFSQSYLTVLIPELLEQHSYRPGPQRPCGDGPEPKRTHGQPSELRRPASTGHDVHVGPPITTLSSLSLSPLLLSSNDSQLVLPFLIRLSSPFSASGISSSSLCSSPSSQNRPV
ncbi:hypothetical protein L596_029411 [Steinernema carpocapsae]|uniref:Uncharacterized protein n=1 Tax=Steinernema carpocapsae TaxID=34508 RepID=A0A4U5LUJ8_STECR|nr:hypothetical protein L596_029411 [Steinernema carpocapsae]